MTTSTAFLARPEGRLAYDDHGNGPLVVCMPGMGDLRQTFRFQRDALAAASFRVVTVDLRGHGDSDATFTAYDTDAAATDLIALVTALGQPAVVIGNSMAAAASVIAAAERPDLIDGLVLDGPFVRNPANNRAMLWMFRAMMARPWARFAWKRFLPSLYAGNKPADFDAYRKQIDEALGRPGHANAFSRTTRTSHDRAEAAAPEVKAPALIVMGSRDPDFPDPGAEAVWIEGALGGPARVVMVDDAGHYPHAQQAETFNTEVLAFLEGLGRDA